MTDVTMNLLGGNHIRAVEHKVLVRGTTDSDLFCSLKGFIA